MNKVIYYTNAVSQSYFPEYLKKWTVAPNLSNQNFHNKLIRAIAKYVKVDVISIRPINRNFSMSGLKPLKEEEKNISWRYPQVSVSRAYKFFFLSSLIKQVEPKGKEDAVIIVDTLNLSCLKAAKSLAARKGYKVFGVCTDNPYNISYAHKQYLKRLMNLGTTLDGYIVLTEAINKIYNLYDKPYVLIDGVSEEVETKPNIYSNEKYIYFGGSLMKQYGVYNLIQAYKELNLEDTLLILCGHHVNTKALHKEIIENPKIVYLGSVNYLVNLSLEKSALVTINPRPIDPKIDNYSIPSKTLESLAVGALNITVDNKLLKEHYWDSIIWAKSSSVHDLKVALHTALSLSKEEKEKIINTGKKKVMERTSLEVVGKIIHDLIA